MPYIGKEPEHGNYQLLDALTAPSGVFNGSRTVFNLTADGVAVYPTSPTTLIISLGGVLQEPNSSYTVSGNQITFTTAPATGTNFFGVSLGDTLDIGTPSDDSVTVAKMADNSVDSDQYVDGSIDGVHIANDAIDSQHYAAGSIDLEHMSSQSVDEDNLHISNAGSNGEFLSKQSGNAGGLTWAAGGGPDQAVQSDIEAETNQDTYVPPDLLKHSPGVAKGWVEWDSGSSIEVSYNVTSVTDNGQGDQTITWATDFSGADYCVVGCNGDDRFISTSSTTQPTAGATRMQQSSEGGSPVDASHTYVAAFGDQ